MDNLEFHVLFNIPHVVAQTVNQMIYNGEEVVKAKMIHRNVQDNLKDMLEEFQFEEENMVYQIIDLNPECSMLIFLINNEENVEIRSFKTKIFEGGKIS